jgi:hypothetical protein
VNGEVILDHTDSAVIDQLQFGISITQGVFPYSSTTIITVVPRYVLVNKLKFDLIVRQYLKGKQGKNVTNDTKYENEIKVPSESKKCMVEMHFKKGLVKKNNRQITVASHYKNINSLNYDSSNQIDSVGYQKADSRWSCPFSVDEIQDFHTEFKVEEPPEPPQNMIGSGGLSRSFTSKGAFKKPSTT